VEGVVDENRVDDRHRVVGESRTASRSGPDAGSTGRPRALSISDFHLGTKPCKVNVVLDFLRSHNAEILYLVGDMVDGWNSGRYWCWGPAQNAAAREIVNWGWRSARILLLPGNHDRCMRFKLDRRSLRTYLKRFLSKAGLTATRLNEVRL
jgi:UDP-2,3-diacylglucosamine pyrophosphatase LpxH